MKQAAGRQRQAALKAGAPVKSVLIRQKGVAAGGLQKAAKKVGAVKGGLGQELGQVKKSGGVVKATGVAKQAGAAVKHLPASRLGRLRRYG
jgi:hypothetical protein